MISCPYQAHSCWLIGCAGANVEWAEPSTRASLQMDTRGSFDVTVISIHMTAARRPGRDSCPSRLEDDLTRGGPEKYAMTSKCSERADWSGFEQCACSPASHLFLASIRRCAHVACPDGLAR